MSLPSDPDMQSPTFEQKAFILLLVLVTIAFFWILLPFYGAVFWAMVLAVVFSPLQERLIRRMGGRGNLAALLTLIICLLVAILPVIFITSAVVAEGTALYQKLESGELDAGTYVTSGIRMLPPSIQEQLARVGISNLDGLRLAFAPRCAHGHKVGPARHGPRRHGRFGTHLITGIDDCDRSCMLQQPSAEHRPVFLRHEVVDCLDHACRVDLRNPLAHGRDLGHAQGVGQRMDLSIDIGLGHMVHVDQRQAPHAAARQTLHSPRAHTTHTHHDHMRLSNTLGP